MEITLKDKASGGSTSITLRIAEDLEENPVTAAPVGVPRIQESRAPALPPRRASGAVSFTDQDPEVDLVWSQDSWQNGAFQPYHRPDDPERYAITDGIDLRFDGVAALFPPNAGQEIGSAWRSSVSMPIIVRNDSFEGNTNLSPWAEGTGVTDTVATDNEISGSQNGVLTTDGSRTSGDILLSQTPTPDHTPLQSKALVISAWIRRISGSESGIKLFVDDGVGNTSGSASTSSSYAKITVSHTMDGSASKLQIGFKIDQNESGAHVFAIDDVVVSANSVSQPALKAVNLDGTIYAAMGHNIMSLDTNENRWEFEFAGSAVITDLIAFKGNVYAAYGFSNSYVYGTTGSWTASNRSAPDDKAKFWAVARNATGAAALWKTESANGISNTTDGINGAATWTTPILVGDTSADITAIYGVFDTVIVGKEDALWEFIRFDPNNSAGDNLFAPVPGSGVGTVVASNNYDQGVEWAGWFWTRVAGHGLVRWQPGNFQRVESLFASPRITDFDLEIQAIGTDQRYLYLVVSDYILVIHQTFAGRLVVHPVTKVPLRTGDANATVIKSIFADRANEGLYIFGASGKGSVGAAVTAAYVWRYHLDTTQPAPFQAGFDMNDNIARTGYFETSIWFADIPSREKAFLALTIWGSGLSSTATIKVEFGVNGAATTTTTLGTFNGTGAIQTLYFHSVTNPETNAVGNTIQLRFTFTLPANATGTSVGPKMFAFGLHSTLNTERFRLWQIEIEAADDLLTSEALEAPESYSDILAALNTLELQTYPIVMLLDVDEDGVDETITVHLRDVRRIRTEEGAERIILLLQEAKTSS